MSLLRKKQADPSEKEEPAPKPATEPAPEHLREASNLHPYAVASYTVSACFDLAFAPSKFCHLS